MSRPLWVAAREQAADPTEPAARADCAGQAASGSGDVTEEAEQVQQVRLSRRVGADDKQPPVKPKVEGLEVPPVAGGYLGDPHVYLRPASDRSAGCGAVSRVNVTGCAARGCRRWHRVDCTGGAAHLQRVGRRQDAGMVRVRGQDTWIRGLKMCNGVATAHLWVWTGCLEDGSPRQVAASSSQTCLKMCSRRGEGLGLLPSLAWAGGRGWVHVAGPERWDVAPRWMSRTQVSKKVP